MSDHEIDPRKENLRLARRVSRLEATLEHLEQIRDANAGVLDTLMADLERERARSDSLLLNVLPQPILDRLKSGETEIADRHNAVTVVFSDLVDFTQISASSSPGTVVRGLNRIFSAFDAHCAAFGVEKIKTIGDAYLAAAGLQEGGPDPVAAGADLALAMRETVREIGTPWRIRISGLHTGPVVAGVIGTRKFVYDIWGDTVNMASRLETSCPPDGIQVSEAVAAALGEAFQLEARAPVDLKGKGTNSTFLLIDRGVQPSPTRGGPTLP